jgi:hypothetical protein
MACGAVREPTGPGRPTRVAPSAGASGTPRTPPTSSRCVTGWSPWDSPTPSWDRFPRPIADPAFTAHALQFGCIPGKEHAI